MMRELFAKVGFGWAVRSLALIMLVALCTSLVVLKPHTQKKQSGPLFKFEMLRDSSYTLFILGKSSLNQPGKFAKQRSGYTFMVAGTYVPYFFIQSYALELGIDENMTFNVVSIMNAATFFGRFPYNYLADL